MLRATLAALALAAAATAATAAEPAVDYSDLWWNPAQDGWGLGLQRQGDVIFAALFVYDAAGAPTWYVASDARPAAADATRWSGRLYRVTGPAFSSPYDGNLAVVAAGDLELAFSGATAGRLDYTIDGRAFSSPIERMTWRVPALAGGYQGGITTLASQCNDPNVNGPFEFTGALTVSESGAATTLRVVSTGAGEPSTCTFTGTRGQSGRLGRLEGGFNCAIYTGTDVRGENPSVVRRLGTFRMEDLSQDADGFSGVLHASDQDCRYDGRVGAVRTEPPAATLPEVSDLWWNAGESGWGAHLTRQGDIVFGVLYVHDAARKPLFLAASALQLVAGSSPPAFTGSLYRTRGSPSTGAYDPRQFAPTAVGRATVTFTSPTQATLAYDVDGVAVTRAITRQTWAAPSLAGTYLGGLHGAAIGCTGGDGSPTIGYPGTVTVAQSGATVTIDTRFEPGFAEVGTCRYVGALAATGSIASITGGTYACAFSNGVDTAGTFGIEGLEVSATGFTGRYRGVEGACRHDAHFGGFRRVDLPPPPPEGQ